MPILAVPLAAAAEGTAATAAAGAAAGAGEAAAAGGGMLARAGAAAGRFGGRALARSGARHAIGGDNEPARQQASPMPSPTQNTSQVEAYGHTMNPGQFG